MNRKRRIPPPPKTILSRWTIQRATVTGLGFGLLALLLAIFAQGWTMVRVYAAVLVLVLICGASILLISLVDAHARQRGDRVRPIRMFDLAMGASLTLLSGWGLYRIWYLLGL
jgi:uncharacterized membrane protein